MGDLHRLECYAPARLHRLGGKHAFCERYPGKVRAAVAIHESAQLEGGARACITDHPPSAACDRRLAADSTSGTSLGARLKSSRSVPSGSSVSAVSTASQLAASVAAQSKHIPFYLAPYCANFSAFETK